MMQGVCNDPSSLEPGNECHPYALVRPTITHRQHSRMKSSLAIFHHDFKDEFFREVLARPVAATKRVLLRARGSDTGRWLIEAAAQTVDCRL